MSDEPKVGRPSKYKPEFCQGLIEHMGQGFSFESFAAVIEVNRDTLYAWEKEYLEFSDAKSIAFDKNLMFWEKLGIDHILNESESFGEGVSRSKSLNSTIWIFNMKNRHKWRDRQPDESADVNVNINNLSDTDLNAKIEEKMKKLNGGNE